MAKVERGWETRAGQCKGGMGREMQGMAGGWRGGQWRGDSLNNHVTVLARYHMLHAVLELCLPPMPKSYVNCCLGEREGKSTKGNRAIGHFCAYPNLFHMFTERSGPASDIILAATTGASDIILVALFHLWATDSQQVAGELTSELFTSMFSTP